MTVITLTLESVSFEPDFYLPGNDVFLCHAKGAGEENTLCVSLKETPEFFEELMQRYLKSGGKKKREIISLSPPLVIQAKIKFETDAVPGPMYTAMLYEGKIL
jgi:hypothetical protein